MYQASSLYSGDFEKVTDEMLKLAKTYGDKIQGLKKEKK
jgi:hypothetical protein